MNKADHVCGRIVEYIGLGDLARRRSDSSAWPFLKRLPYAHEDEYRIISGATVRSLPSEMHFRVPLAAIRSIRVNPFLNESRSDKIIKFLRAMCEKHRLKDVRIYKSTVLSNRDWLAEVNGL
jgi:hypothetical protein